MYYYHLIHKLCSSLANVPIMFLYCDAFNYHVLLDFNQNSSVVFDVHDLATFKDYRSVIL